MSGQETPEPARPIRDGDELAEPFRRSEKPAGSFLIGAETEKLGVNSVDGTPLGYAGDFSVLRIFEELSETRGWKPVGEHPEGPTIALLRGASSITLEPGAQVELSGSPLPDVHAVVKEQDQHLHELTELRKTQNLAWLGIGFHPFARQTDLPWVPKQRYRIMKEYLPTRGRGGLDMMRRTATTQVNFDYESEQDALRKLRLTLKLSPIVHACTANAPIREGQIVAARSVRGQTWLQMDPQRSGLVPRVWEQGAGYSAYIEYGLDAGMILFKRGAQIVENTGQSFRDFLEHGFEGHRATLQDWQLHLATLFPEARLKNTLELRSADSLPLPVAASVIALYTGVLYDEQALSAAENVVRELTYNDLQAARPSLVIEGPRAKLLGRSITGWLEPLIDLSAAGLARRRRLDENGKDESIYLHPLSMLVESGKCPADLLVQGLSDDENTRRAQIIERARLRPLAG